MKTEGNQILPAYLVNSKYSTPMSNQSFIFQLRDMSLNFSFEGHWKLVIQLIWLIDEFTRCDSKANQSFFVDPKVHGMLYSSYDGFFHSISEEISYWPNSCFSNPNRLESYLYSSKVDFCFEFAINQDCGFNHKIWFPG